MSNPVSPHVSSADELLDLHTRLRAGCGTAGAELCRRLMDRLVQGLYREFRHVDEHLRWEAAGEALLSLIRRPESIPDGTRLEAYLLFAARRDLLNRLPRERRYRQRHVSLNAVEDSSDGGNYPGRDDDPSLPLQRAEETSWFDSPSASAVIAKFDPQERIVFDCMRAGDKDTQSIARALAASHHPLAVQQRMIKKIRDRIIKRLQRAGGDCERIA